MVATALRCLRKCLSTFHPFGLTVYGDGRERQCEFPRSRGISRKIMASIHDMAPESRGMVGSTKPFSAMPGKM
jgi:hypothetical protein